MAKKTKNQDGRLEMPSVLAFERKLNNSDGIMYSGRWDEMKSSENWRAISVREKAVRGTISNRLKAKDGSDPTKLDAKIEDANLQRVDVAALFANDDTLKLSFTLRVLGSIDQAWTCNNQQYQAKLTTVIQKYISDYGFDELARRYAANLANGRFLWRNRVGAESIKVKINGWEFDGDKFNLRSFQENDNSADFTALVNEIKRGLTGEAPVLLKVEAFAKIGEGQEIFPSQELILDDEKEKKKGKKSKTLYAVDEIAALHSQKIGNALRTIDTWYGLESTSLGPIAVEPYGSVTNRGMAYRQPRDKKDFYTLFDGWVCDDQELTEEEQHFVVANLIRGGVFGASGKEG